MLQISLWWEDEHGGPDCATFKCLGCKSELALYKSQIWNFCPICGVQLVVTHQDIKRKEYHPAWDFLNGKQTSAIVPRFRLMIERDYWNHDPLELEPVFGMPRLGRHSELVWELRRELGLFKPRKPVQGTVQWRLIPTESLPLP